MLHPPPVLWQPQIGGVPGALRTHRQPQTGPAPDARAGLGRDGARPQHQSGTPAAQDVLGAGVCGRAGNRVIGAYAARGAPVGGVSVAQAEKTRW